jgi:ribosomal protein S18 acetylase RimI-like enzyme
MDFTVRAAKPADLPAAARLGAELVRFHHGLDPERFAILADPPEPGYARFLAGRLEDREAVVLVACARRDSRSSGEGARKDSRTSGSRAEGAIIGYAFGQLEPLSWMDLLGPCGRFHDLIVHPAHRGRGVGRALAEMMLARLRQLGAPRIVLSVAWANPAARRLFESLGFRPTMVEMTR